MEDLYENLDNFNDQGIIEELKSENKELKFKIDEYASALGKLQKEFDKLASEHKHLEQNYSSLLKTARAEIERKTQIITTLNIEKDAMVLNSIQNKGNYRKPFIRNFGKNKDNSDKPDMRIKNEGGRTQNDSDRKDVKSPLPNVSNVNIDRSTYSKENNVHQHNDPSSHSMPRSRIRDRRKSTPASSFNPENVNTDEDNEVTSESIRSGVSNPNDYAARNDRNRQSSRISEGYSGYSRNSGNYDTRDLPRRHSRQLESEKYGDRHDKNRPKRHYSPERPKREYRDIYDDVYQRGELDRHKNYENLTNEKYNPYRRPREPQRPYYDRNPNEYDKFKTRNHDNYPGKHKSFNDYEEPTNKRMRVDTYNKYHEEEPWRTERYHQPEPFNAGQFMSCQSPDNLLSEPNPNHQIKEIKFSATSKLDDPRISSKKYFLRENDGKSSLFAVQSRNVDIRPFKSKWEINPVSMPDALSKRPSSPERDVKDICMDIRDSSVPNVSNQTCDRTDTDRSPNQQTKTEICQDKTTVAVTNDKTPHQPTSYKISKRKGGSDSASHKVKDTNVDKPEKDNKPTSKVDVNVTESDVKKIHNKSESLGVILKEKPIQLLTGNSSFNFEQKHYISPKEMVAGDLELSDETCDNTEIHREITPRTDTNFSGTIERKLSKEIDSFAEKAFGVSSSAEPNNELQKTEDSCKHKASDDHKKSKPKKRSPKSKDKDQVVEAHHSKEKPKRKEKVKETKTKHIKNKFSELFDDSSSLISPEDLGLVEVKTPLEPAVPFFEDAQDANDLIVDKEPIENALVEPTRSLNTVTNDTITKSETEKISHTNPERTIISPKLTKNKPENKSKDASIESKVDIYENLIPNIVTKEDDVVKTVIISTGVQPATESVEHAVKDNVIDKMTSKEFAAKAFATSTPHKALLQLASETDTKGSDQSCNSNDREPTIDNSTTNATHGNDGDVPDVRIYVRRRRKVKKT